MSIAAYPSDPITELYANHHGWLRGWLRKKSGGHDRAADLAHDTFVRILSSNIPTALDQPRAYLTTIAKGLLINWHQRQALERAYLDALAYANRARSTPTTPTHGSYPATRWPMRRCTTAPASANCDWTYARCSTATTTATHCLAATFPASHARRR